ncbi:MAG: NAD(P)H-hydrate dehydratase [Akkermansia sp.]|nr:NAD(P)H-hydrate dehydratase [Akkermansia sp.]
MNIHPCAVIREAEQALFAGGETTSAELMSTVVERLWQAAQQEPVLCGIRPRRVVVYAGRGNNAGDALGLASRFRCPVTLRAVCEPQAFSPESLEQFALLAGHEVSVAPPEPQEGLLIIDGLLGSGATGALREPYAALVQELNALREQSPRSCTLAIDVPTGLNADTGEVPGAAVRADVTAVIGCVKPGMLADGAEDYVGRLLCIPLPEVALPQQSPGYVATADVLRWLPRRQYSCFKNKAGRVHIVAGSVGYVGAAQMCAESAQAAGAGLVALYCHEDVYPLLAAREAPEIMVHPVKTYADVPTDGAQALVVGPGVGRLRGDEVRALHNVLLRCTVPLVLDADGLNLAAEYGWELPPQCILTPHPGEMRRLLSGGSGSRVEQAMAYLQSHACTLLLKGARTLITDGTELWYNSTGGPYMANGGQGDVLAGCIGALAAQGLGSLQAAVLGAYACGKAAETAHMQAGYPRAIRAMDVVAYLGRVLG